MSNTVDDFLHGRVSTDEMRERVLEAVAVAKKRLTGLTRRRPFVACGVALAAGYLAGRVIARS